MSRTEHLALVKKKKWSLLDVSEVVVNSQIVF